MSILFEPVRLGELQLANRIVMAPMTRSRADQHGVPTPEMVEYYRQRASADVKALARRVLGKTPIKALLDPGGTGHDQVTFDDARCAVALGGQRITIAGNEGDVLSLDRFGKGCGHGVHEIVPSELSKAFSDL